jgi:hypothetical protein
MELSDVTEKTRATPGIDPRTFRLNLNHYATSGPHKGDNKNNIVMGSLYHEILDVNIVRSNLISLARRADSSKSRGLLKNCDWEKLEILLVLSLSLPLSLSLSHTNTHTELQQ